MTKRLLLLFLTGLSFAATGCNGANTSAADAGKRSEHRAAGGGDEKNGGRLERAFRRLKRTCFLGMKG